MSEVLQIQRLILSRFQQFDYCDLDFTDPASGDPLGQVCLTGPCGVGKSTLLAHLCLGLDRNALSGSGDASSGDSLVLTKYRLGEETFYRARKGACPDATNFAEGWYGGDIEGAQAWSSLAEDPPGYDGFVSRFAEFRVEREAGLPSAPTITAFLGPDGGWIDSESADDFDAFLESLRRERLRGYLDFLGHPDNRERTVAEVEAEFDETCPDLLGLVAELWRAVLAERQLLFHPHSESPLTCSRSGAEIAFSDLSPGLQRALLRSAQVFCRFHRHPDRPGYLFLDEPESGLDETLLAKSLRFLQTQLKNQSGQLFVATQSPLVTSLFEPEELLLLDFDDANGVSVERCLPEEEPPREETAPPDRPPTSGNRLTELKRSIRETEDQDELADLLDEFLSLRKL